MNQCEISLQNDCLNSEAVLFCYSVDRCVPVCKSAFWPVDGAVLWEWTFTAFGIFQLCLVSAKVNVYDPLKYMTKTNCVSVFFLVFFMDLNWRSYGFHSFIECQLSGVSSQLPPVQQLKLVTQVIPFAHKGAASVASSLLCVLMYWDWTWSCKQSLNTWELSEKQPRK